MYVCTMWFVNEKDGDVEVWRERNAERKKKKKKTKTKTAPKSDRERGEKKICC